MSSRRLLLVLGTSLVLSGSQARAAAPPLRIPTPPQTGSGVIFRTDVQAAARLDEVGELLKKEKWADALPLLQALLDAPADGRYALPRGDTWLSAHAEASRRLDSLPDKALQEYRRLYDAPARELLKSAEGPDRRALLTEVSSRYLHTDAGAEATTLLGSTALDAGDFVLASLCFRRVFLSPGRADQMAGQTLTRAVVAFRRAGDEASAAKAWKLLTAKVGNDTVRFDGRRLKLDEFAKELDQLAPAKKDGLADWPMYRGDVGRTAVGKGGAPHLEAAWTVKSLPDKNDQRAWVDDYVRQASNFVQGRKFPVMSAFQPVGFGGKVLFRTYDGMYSYDLREKNPQLRAMWQFTDGGVAGLLGDPNKKAVLEQWKGQYLQTGTQSILFENSVTGTLTTDGKRAFVVDDLLLPPNQFAQFRGFGLKPNFGHLNDQVYRNTLMGYNLESGKLMWVLGWKNGCTNEALDQVLGVRDEDGKIVPTSSSYFMAPPLPMGGNLYVLNERAREVRLLCLQPKDDRFDRAPPAPALHWSQPLVQARDGIGEDIFRRVHAAHLSYGDGVLVCPTNAGALVGVDLLSHRPLWVHRYRRIPGGANAVPAPAFDAQGRPIPNLTLLTSWKNTAPAIVDGKVVFALPDGDSLRCVGLHDGKQLWDVKKTEDDIYFAGVFGDKCVIVSKNAVRAINLADGTEAWKQADTGLPSGQGVAAGGVYYLPIQANGDNKPEVLALDLARGTVRAHIASKADVPGNLIFYEGQLISQTLTSVSAYPLVKAKAEDK